MKFGEKFSISVIIKALFAFTIQDSKAASIDLRDLQEQQEPFPFSPGPELEYLGSYTLQSPPPDPQLLFENRFEESGHRPFPVLPAQALLGFPPPQVLIDEDPEHEDEGEHQGQPVDAVLDLDFRDPNFFLKTGYEGFLAPTYWYGLLPWAVEGLGIATLGAVVFMIIFSAIALTMTWLVGYGDWHLLREQAREISKSIDGMNLDGLQLLGTSVFNALEAYEGFNNSRITK